MPSTCASALRGRLWCRLLEEVGHGVPSLGAAQVMIETVDSFQGKQLDVVMLSCVRAAKPQNGAHPARPHSPPPGTQRSRQQAVHASSGHSPGTRGRCRPMRQIMIG